MKLDTSSAIWQLAMDRPPVNAFGMDQFDGIIEAITNAAASASCKALVLTGNNGVFTGGMDIKLLPTLDGGGIAKVIRNINRLTYELYRLPKPVAAAVSGHAIGLGAVIMACSDMRVVSHGDYRIGLNELDAGLPFPACAALAVTSALSPAAQHRLCLGSALHKPENPILDELIDVRCQPEDVLTIAMHWAEDRAKQAIYGAVKQQLRGQTIAQMQLIVDTDNDPLLATVDETALRFKRG